MTDSPQENETLTSKVSELWENTWVKIVFALGSSCLGIGCFWLTWQGLYGTPELTFEIPPNGTQTIYTDENLRVVNGTQALSAPFSTAIKFQNVGSKQLEVVNYDDDVLSNGPGLCLEAGNPASKIVTCNATWTYQSTRRNPTTKIINERTVFIKPVALHNGEGFAVNLITEGNPAPIKVSGHLSTGRIYELRRGDWTSFFNNLWTGFLALGAFLGIVSFCLHIYWYFAFKGLIKWAIKGILKIIVKILSLFSGSGASKHAKTPERARQILASVSEFDNVAQDVNADTAEKKDKLRQDLAMIASIDSTTTPTTQSDDQTSLLANDVDKISPSNSE